MEHHLFNYSNFMPHGHCYLWKPEILWLHVLSDLIISIAYFSIPITLLTLIYKRKKFPLKWLISLFAAFILLCGTTHILGIITQWVPIYVIQGFFKLATAIVSIATAFAIFPILPSLLEGAEKIGKENKDL
jgi:hypothetical protein